MTPVLHRVLLALVASALGAGCSSSGVVQLALSPDLNVSSAADLKSRIARFDVVVSSPQGLSGVTEAGPRSGGGVAKDWDGDGHLDVVFSTDHALNAELPVLEVGVDAYAGSLLEFHVLGYGADGDQLVAFGGSATTPSKHDLNRLGVPFNLRPEVRPPQVLMVLPPDGAS